MYSPTKQNFLPAREALTIHRKGSLNMSGAHPNQCYRTGHTSYRYVVRIACAPSLDAQGFLIDHDRLHDAMQSLGKAPDSCENLCLRAVRCLRATLEAHGCKWLRIYVMLAPKGANVAAFMEYEEVAQ